MSPTRFVLVVSPKSFTLSARPTSPAVHEQRPNCRPRLASHSAHSFQRFRRSTPPPGERLLQTFPVPYPTAVREFPFREPSYLGG